MKRSLLDSSKGREPASKRAAKDRDFFSEHFCCNLPDELIAECRNDTITKRTLTSSTIFENHSLQISLNNKIDVALEEPKSLVNTENLSNGIDKRLAKALDRVLPSSEANALFSLAARYLNVCMVSKELDYKKVFCLHILNHILRTRNLVISNQKKIESVKNELTDDIIEECRDQGLNRPKVLVLTPFKKMAYEVVHNMADILLPGDAHNVLNLAKFDDEYGQEGSAMHKSWRAPQEFKDLLSGNIDDSFRIGVSLGKKAIKLYSAFSKSDIIIASPLGLRMIIGEDNDETEAREIDFLSSIEVVVIDRVDVLFMQNWEHLLTVLNALNQMPKEIETDISRVRHWVLQGQGSLYRQTLAFSEVNIAELHTLFSGKEQNISGTALITSVPNSLLENIECSIVQELHRFDCEDASQQADLRFAYFVRNLLPKLKQGTVVFISSYFDYIRVRNYLKRDNESFAQIHEYASDGKVRKSRKAFQNGERKLLLITERCQYFRHFQVKGVKSVVFYQMPVTPRFYIDVINMAQTETTLHTSLIYSKTDVLRMYNVFGVQQTKELLLSQKKFHALISE